MNTTKKAWSEIVTPEDLGSHLSAIGQAQANGRLTTKMISDFPLVNGSSILIPGAGTGQLFDFVDVELFRTLQMTLTEISPSFIEALKSKLEKYRLAARVLNDDIENSSLVGQKFDSTLGILLLEHIDWKKGMSQILQYKPRHLFFIIQEQEPQAAMITQRELAPTMKKFSEVAKPQLVARSELIIFLEKETYVLKKEYEAAVPDCKRMVGLVFQKKKEN